jgi:hypothetical protein
MAQIVSSRADHLANAAFGAVALVIVVVTLRLLGISPPGATMGAKAPDPPAAESQANGPSEPAQTRKARDDTLVQAAPDRLGVSWHVHAVVSRQAPPPPRAVP